MEGQHPLVSVVIPARNERDAIEACLAAVGQQTHPKDRLEVLVVDGGSSDDTAVIAQRTLDRLGVARGVVISNKAGTTPSNLNAGLAFARGAYVCRVDARSVIPPDYVRRCVGVLAARPDVAVVGGSQVAKPPSADAVGLGIARALNNRLGMGLSRYRRGASSGPADTVYLGAFRTVELRKAGGWDTTMATNQDFDLNRRMSRFGVVWFEARLEVGYIPRRTLRDLYTQYRRFGEWKVRYWRHRGTSPQPRQLVLLAAPPAGVLAGVGLLAAFRHHPGALIGTLASAAIAASALEYFGPTGPRAPVRAHLISLAASTVVGVGWTVGCWSTLVRRSDHAAPAPLPSR